MEGGFSAERRLTHGNLFVLQDYLTPGEIPQVCLTDFTIPLFGLGFDPMEKPMTCALALTQVVSVCSQTREP